MRRHPFRGGEVAQFVEEFSFHLTKQAVWVSSPYRLRCKKKDQEREANWTSLPISGKMDKKLMQSLLNLKTAFREECIAGKETKVLFNLSQLSSSLPGYKLVRRQSVTMHRAARTELLILAHWQVLSYGIFDLFRSSLCYFTTQKTIRIKVMKSLSLLKTEYQTALAISFHNRKKGYPSATVHFRALFFLFHGDFLT